MTDDKTVEEQYHKLQKIGHEIFAEGMLLPEQFQIVVIIDKFPLNWKNFKNILKHKNKEFSLESLITRLQIEADVTTEVLKIEFHR